MEAAPQATGLDPNKYNEEFMMILKQVYDKQEELTAISMQQYQSLFSTMMRDEIQIILPMVQTDIFSEELRILINNTYVSQNQ